MPIGHTLPTFNKRSHVQYHIIQWCCVPKVLRLWSIHRAFYNLVSMPIYDADIDLHIFFLFGVFSKILMYLDSEWRKQTFRNTKNHFRWPRYIRMRVLFWYHYFKSQTENICKFHYDTLLLSITMTYTEQWKAFYCVPFHIAVPSLSLLCPSCRLCNWDCFANSIECGFWQHQISAIHHDYSLRLAFVSSDCFI